MSKILCITFISFFLVIASSDDIGNTEVIISKLTVQSEQTVCKSRPESCKDVVSNKSRVLVVLSSGLEVMCDTETDGGGWTIFQRRMDGNLSFYRGWEEYKYGFGDYIEGDFYLGNENVHKITIKRRHELRIDFTFLQNKYFAHYSNFRLFGEPEGYRLLVSNFTGTAGDSLSQHNDMKFTTFDKDFDIADSNCAQVFKGAWWYKRCHVSNLNGLWGATEYAIGMTWQTTTGDYNSASMTEMKFRSVR